MDEEAGGARPACGRYGVIFRVLDIFLRRRWRAQVALFSQVVGYEPRIAYPTRYHEKMLWRKIFDHDPQFTVFSDKLAAKDFIRARLPALPVPENLWVGKSLAAAPPGLIGRDVVIKTNHGSSFNYFPAQEPLPWQELCERFDAWLSALYGEYLAEWGYFDIER